jgi:hypothetical protein
MQWRHRALFQQGTQTMEQTMEPSKRRHEQRLIITVEPRRGGRGKIQKRRFAFLNTYAFLV